MLPLGLYVLRQDGLRQRRQVLHEPLLREDDNLLRQRVLHWQSALLQRPMLRSRRHLLRTGVLP